MTDKEARRLKIGCVVRVRAYAEMAYENEYEEADRQLLRAEEDEFGLLVGAGVKIKRTVRKAKRYELAEPRVAVVTGARNAPTGEYCPASSDGYECEPDPPSLSQTGTVLLVAVRERLFGKQHWALPADVELVKPAGGSAGT